MATMWGPTGSFNTVWVAPNVNRGIRRQTQITAAPPTGSFNGNSWPLDPIVYDQANGASVYRRVLASHSEALKWHIDMIMIGLQISAPKASKLGYAHLYVNSVADRSRTHLHHHLIKILESSVYECVATFPCDVVLLRLLWVCLLS